MARVGSTVYVQAGTHAAHVLGMVGTGGAARGPTNAEMINRGGKPSSNSTVGRNSTGGRKTTCEEEKTTNSPEKAFADMGGFHFDQVQFNFNHAGVEYDPGAAPTSL